jgi:phage regulator Rha-like protein
VKQERFNELQRELAAIARQEAELQVKRAAIHDELAGADAHPRTGRRAQRPHLPQIATPVSSIDQARAAQALQQLERRRSFGR